MRRRSCRSSPPANFCAASIARLTRTSAPGARRSSRASCGGYRCSTSTAGERIGPHDLWLAATCIAHGLTLITANVREFARVPGLRLEDWRNA